MNPYKKAFQEPVNLLALAVVTAVSAAMLTPLPACFGAVAEAAYLLFIPGTAWYGQRLMSLSQPSESDDFSSRGVAARRLERARKLPPVLSARFQRLQQVRAEIEQKVSAQASFQPEIIAKLDQLMDQFLDFGTNQTQFISYLQSLLAQQGAINDPRRPILPPSYVTQSGEQYPLQQPVQNFPGGQNDHMGRTRTVEDWAQWAVGRIQAHFNDELNRSDPSSESDPSLKELKQKRVDVLSRRNELVGRIGKIVTNISLQLQLIEDTFGLIDDEVSTQKPDQVLGEIDNLMVQTDALTKSLAEVSDLYRGEHLSASG